MCKTVGAMNTRSEERLRRTEEVCIWNFLRKKENECISNEKGTTWFEMKRGLRSYFCNRSRLSACGTWSRCNCLSIIASILKA